MSQGRVSCAMALLRQLGLYSDSRKVLIPGERPAYTERDVVSAMDTDKSFRDVYGELQRILGRVLNTEELKIILGFQRYLGMDPHVICMLFSYCVARAKEKGSLRAPSLRSIEKEAYAWAEQGIDTVEEVSAYIQRQHQRRSQLGQLKKLLQIRDRELTATEEKYARQWLEMGFSQDALAIAYDRTCVNTGNLSWSYMNRILTRWHEAGLHTAEQIKNKDRKPEVPKGASGQLGQAELENIQRLLQED
jgi:DnaD/phage-associated family protein